MLPTLFPLFTLYLETPKSMKHWEKNDSALQLAYALGI